MIDINCLGPCNPKQVVNLLLAINDLSQVEIYHDDIKYNKSELEYAYSVDSICWSCYTDYNTAIANTIGIKSDFYARIKVNGKVDKVTYNCEDFIDYKCSIAEGFNYGDCLTMNNQNIYNPYINMECAIALQQQMTETVACMFGIPIYYIKLNGNGNSKDLTFKEYTLLNVKDIKQIKMIIQDNQMPSSKPEFSEFGLDWQTDWECELSKGMFATAFGVNVQPMEGDLIYVPMQKRMWMLSGAYEEKKDALMWNATTFKITLVKYQDKGSVDLGDAQDFVDGLVKNKYDDLFGTDENLGASTDSLPNEKPIDNSAYPIFESDSLRKYANIDALTFNSVSTYHNNSLISDSVYVYMNTATPGVLAYQKTYCGEDGLLSFIMSPSVANYDTTLFKLGSVTIKASQQSASTILTACNSEKLKITLEANVNYFIYLRWSRMLNTISFVAAPYVHKDVPEYMLQKQHYYYDLKNAITKSDTYNIELVQDCKTDLQVSMCVGTLTNIKLFTKDTDNVSEIIQMMPTSSNLLINDTARQFNVLRSI